MASSAGSALTAEDEKNSPEKETALVPWEAPQPSRDDAVALGPARAAEVATNPFWSERAHEEAQLRALRPKDLPDTEEGQRMPVQGAGGVVYGAEVAAGGVEELMGRSALAGDEEP